MADIKKQLILEVSLGTSKLKAEIAAAKKELEGIAKDSSSPASIERTTKAKIDSEKKVEAARKKLLEKTSNEALDDQQKLDSERFKGIEKAAKLEKAHKEKIAKETEREETKQARAKVRRKEQEDAKTLREFNKLADAQERRETQAFQKRLRESEKLDGGGPGGPGESGPSGFEKFGKFAKGALGIAGTVGSAGLSYIELQRAMTEREFRNANDIRKGEVFTRLSRQHGRGEALGMGAGALAGAGAGGLAGAQLGSFFGPMGTLVGGAIGAVGGGIAGGIKGSNMMGEYRAEQAQLLESSYQSARGMNKSRLGSIRGGAGSIGLDWNEQKGAAAGFSPEEALQQYQQGQSILGNKNTSQTIDALRQIVNGTGADFGTAASFTNTMAGSGRESGAEASAKTFSVIEKAISSGLDRSKTSKFLQDSSNYINSQTGFSKLDTGSTMDRMTQLASSFGEGTISDMSTSQAMRSLQMRRQESVQTEGISGLGNITGIQGAFSKANVPLSSDTMLGISSLSSGASPDAITQALKQSGLSDDQIKQVLPGIVSAKQDTLGAGLNAAGITGGLRTFVGAKERGQYGEDFMSEQAAFNNKKPLETGYSIDREAGTTTKTQEFQLEAGQAEKMRAELEFGRTAFKTAIEQTAKDLEILQEAFRKSAGYYNENVGGGPRTTPDSLVATPRNQKGPF